MTISGSRSRIAREIVVLPAQKGRIKQTSIRGAAFSNRRPKGSLHVLRLLTKLIDCRLHFQSDACQCLAGGFRTKCIRLAIEFLAEEVQSAPDWFGTTRAPLPAAQCASRRSSSSRTSAFVASTATSWANRSSARSCGRSRSSAICALRRSRIAPIRAPSDCAQSYRQFQVGQAIRD